MTCREFVEFIGNYLSGEMLPQTKETFEGHLQRCDNCRRYLEIYGDSIALGQRAFDETAWPTDVPTELVDAIMAARKRST